MSIQQFHRTLSGPSEKARSFRQLQTLGVDDLRKTGRQWDPWTPS